VSNFLQEYILNKLITIFCLLILPPVKGEEVCGRVGTINSQEILIDLNSSQKGEGLRPHLEKDPIASSYFRRYQKNNEFQWHDAALGTTGAVLTISGLFFNIDPKYKKGLLLAGSSLIIANFILGYSLKNANQKNLERAILEYNKRNNPKIFVSPLSYKNTQKMIYNRAISLSKTWSF
jgi:hypothetical protein